MSLGWGFPVLAMNPSSGGAKGSMKTKTKDVIMGTGLAILAGAAVGGLSYALDGTNLPRLATGAIKLAGGAAIGGAVGMANKPLGYGAAGGGAALGIYDIGSEAVGAMASGGNGNGNGNSTTSGLRSGLRGSMGNIMVGGRQAPLQMRAAVGRGSMGRVMMPGRRRY